MGALLFKPDVTLKPDPAGARLLGTLDRVARSWPSDLMVTSGSDSHPPSDVHSFGRAFDVRTRTLTDDEKRTLLRAVLLDLQDGGVMDAPHELALPGIWFAATTTRWFAQIEHHGEDGEHLHVQLRRGVTWPPVPSAVNA